MLERLEKALKETGYPFAHHAWDSAPDGDYGVFGEDNATSLWADGKMVEQFLGGTVDLFTRDNSDFPKEIIQSALDSLGVPWYLNSIQYENDTMYIHYEWVFDAVYGNN